MQKYTLNSNIDYLNQKIQNSQLKSSEVCLTVTVSHKSHAKIVLSSSFDTKMSVLRLQRPIKVTFGRFKWRNHDDVQPICYFFDPEDRISYPIW